MISSRQANLFALSLINTPVLNNHRLFDKEALVKTRCSGMFFDYFILSIFLRYF